MSQCYLKLLALDSNYYKDGLVYIESKDERTEAIFSFQVEMQSVASHRHTCFVMWHLSSDDVAQGVKSSINFQ